MADAKTTAPLPQETGIRAVIGTAIFNNRALLLLLFAIATGWFAYQASQLRPDASFEKMLPVSHSYIINYIENKADLSGLGNSVRIVVETTEGDIFTKEFQKLLQEVTDSVFYIPGVDRAGMQSLWTPNVRWQEVTEEGFVGGAVIPDDYDGSERSLKNLRTNTLKSGQIGRLVANNFKSATIVAPLAEINPKTGERLDYKDFSDGLEKEIRKQYQKDNVKVHITGFAKLVGDLIDGASQVAIFFAVAFLITAILLYLYCRCHWCTAIPLLCSTIAVVWQLGLLNNLGFGLDPYSMLVPFLVFAIGISHSVQIIKHFSLCCHEGESNVDSAFRAFYRLSKPGFIALVSDGVGFLTLRVIDIPVIQELALAAGMGVAVIIMTNLVLLPILLSYTGVSQSCRNLLDHKDSSQFRQWRLISAAATPGPARTIALVCLALFAVGIYYGQQQKIGDLDPGAPELRADSRYNLDNAFLTENYATSTDVFVVMVNTGTQKCGTDATVSAIDYFQGVMGNVPGVQSVLSLVDISKLVIMGMNEGNPKWHALSRNQFILNNSLSRVPTDLLNTDCSLVPVMLFLDDHKADTLTGVVEAVEKFAEENNSDAISFKLAAGNAGIEAATNIVISRAQYQMLAWVYGVVILLCLINFRSFKITACIIVPLMLTSALGQALMTFMGIGVKVATLPVIALGVGIGVDYGIYIYSALQRFLDENMGLREAYFETLKSSGSAVAFTGLTLAIGVGTWIFSPIKFQADMGLMLMFMFFWNMVGALLFLPALAYLLNVGKRGSTPVASTSEAVTT